jgi:hypothetical protein
MRHSEGDTGSSDKKQRSRLLSVREMPNANPRPQPLAESGCQSISITQKPRGPKDGKIAAKRPAVVPRPQDYGGQAAKNAKKEPEAVARLEAHRAVAIRALDSFSQRPRFLL